MGTAIQCAQCGFTYDFTDEEIRYTGFVCPSCKTTAPRVEVEVDLLGPHAVVDCLRRPTPTGTQPVKRERVPALIDALDARLALWIAGAMLDDSAPRPACPERRRRARRHAARARSRFE